MMYDLEQILYWSYEQTSKAVVASPTWTERTASEHRDRYAAIHAAALLHLKVQSLPDTFRAIIEAKYGMLPESLNALVKVLVDKFKLTHTVAQGLLLHWLRHKTRPKLWQLADALGCSERTMKRKSREVQLFLDDLRLQALHSLDS